MKIILLFSLMTLNINILTADVFKPNIPGPIGPLPLPAINPISIQENDLAKLFTAIAKNDNNTVKMLATKYKNTDFINTHYAPQTGDTPLISAVKKGFANIVQTLLSNGAHIDDTDKDGNTALMLTEFPYMVDILLTAHPKLDSKNHAGETALSKAQQRAQRNKNNKQTAAIVQKLQAARR